MVEDDSREAVAANGRLRSRPVASPGRLSGLSVFLPAHNEEENLELVVAAFAAELTQVADAYEIVIVDDGSRDRTGEIADRLSAADAHIRVIHHPLNRGYGGAVISGMRACTMPFILLSDSDGQFDPGEMSRLIAYINDYDVVIGRRARRADHLMRRINGKAWTTLSSMLFGLHITDMDCGFKLFRRDSVEGLDLRSDGAMITTELMARLVGRGARIKEVDVTHLPRFAGEQSGNSPKAIVKAFRDLFKLYRELQVARNGTIADS
ncbi:MAG TPA: glycosyltransferase family 2 protein [Candidatus Binataceae bacterium]|nr:glycosyltransferase family 2 protein [Candidatus Binataceae bacterium]